MKKRRSATVERFRELLVMQGAKQQTARKKNIAIYGHRIENIRPMRRKVDKTAHFKPVDCPLNDVQRTICYRQKQSTLNNTAEVQKFGEHIQLMFFRAFSSVVRQIPG
jgi:hypothetical protein